MATPEQQRRSAEMSRVLAANGWGVIGFTDSGGTISLLIRKPTSAIRAGTVSENMAALRFLVEQFRWTVAAYDAATDHHTATVSTP